MRLAEADWKNNTKKTFAEDVGMRIELVDVFNRPKGKFMGGQYDTLAISGKDLFISLDAELQRYGELLMSNKKGSIVAH